MSVSTHVLDSVLGRPAAGVAVRMFAGEELAAEGGTDADGRCRLAVGANGAGAHRLVFATRPWFAHPGRGTLYPQAALAFVVRRTIAPPERQRVV